MEKTRYGITVTPERALEIVPKNVTMQMVADEAREQSRMVYISYTLHNGRRIFKSFSVVEKRETA